MTPNDIRFRNYEYIERMHGTRFSPGMKVLFSEYDDAPGVVAPPIHDSAYVRVKFDDGREGNCHPASLKILPMELK